MKIFQISHQHTISFAEIWPRTMYILFDGIDCGLQTWLYEVEVNIFLKDTRERAEMREDIREQVPIDYKVNELK